MNCSTAGSMANVLIGAMYKATTYLLIQWLERSNQYSGRSWVQLPLGNSEKSFSEYLTWDHFYTHFLFIQVTISLLIYSHLSFGHIWALQPGRTCVAHKNPVYDFAHHESPIAQWLECSNRYSGRSWVRLWVFDLRSFLYSLSKNCCKVLLHYSPGWPVI